MTTSRHSPILSLPSEMTIEIFKHGLPPCDNPWRNPKFADNPSRDLPWPSPSEAPLLVAQICHQWREICLDAPELWAVVAFGDTRSIELLKAWLLRARNHPLILFLESDDHARATMLLHTLLPYRHQWQEIHFYLPMKTLRQLNNTATFPRLERLTLAVMSRGFSAETDIIRGAPLLRFAQTFAIPDLMVDPPSRNLSTLHLAFSGTAILRCCPNLRDLRCHSTWAEGDSPVYLPALRSLDITNKRNLVFPTVPLIVRIGNVDASADADILQEMVARSSCELQFLEIGLRRGTAVALQHFLGSVKSILHLRIYFRSESDPPIEALERIDVLPPRLKHLEIRVRGEQHYGALLYLVRWRAQHTALESFMLNLPGTPADAILTEFHSIAEPGLKVPVVR